MAQHGQHLGQLNYIYWCSTCFRVLRHVHKIAEMYYILGKLVLYNP